MSGPIKEEDMIAGEYYVGVNPSCPDELILVFVARVHGKLEMIALKNPRKQFNGTHWWATVGESLHKYTEWYQVTSVFEQITASTINAAKALAE